MKQKKAVRTNSFILFDKFVLLFIECVYTNSKMLVQTLYACYDPLVPYSMSDFASFTLYKNGSLLSGHLRFTAV